MFPKFDMLECVGAQMRNAGFRADDQLTASFARELEYIQAAPIERLYPEYKFSTLVPLKVDAPAGAQSHTWREVQDFGDAQILENVAPEDFPTADVTGSENTGKFRSLGTKYSYTIEDLRRESMMTIKPTERKSEIARRVVEGRFDRLVFGKSGAGMGPFTGLADNTSSQDDTASAGVTADWTLATALQIADTFRAVADKVFTTSNGLFEQVDFVLGINAMTYLGKQLNTYNDKTVADYILSSVPRVRSISWSGRLTGAGGDASHDRMLAYPRDPQVLEAYIPTRFEQLPPQLRGAAFEVYCMAKYGGLRIYHPNVIRRVDVKIA